MKNFIKFLLFFIFYLSFLFFSKKTFSQTVIFSDNFESKNFSQWTRVDEGWRIITYSGNSRAHVDGKIDKVDCILLKLISTQNYKDIQISFKVKVGKLEKTDHIFFEWSGDGQNWEILEDFTEGNDNITQWTEKTYSLPENSFDNQNFQFRFRATLNAEDDSFDVDEILVSGFEIQPEKSLCNKNGVCDAGENFENCPEDCKFLKEEKTEEKVALKVVINEFIPDPKKEEKEWIELYNPSPIEVDLDGWEIEEGSGMKTPLKGKIPSKGFFLIENIHGYLNNKGDLIILRDSSGNVLDKVAFGNFDDGNLADNAPCPKKLFSLSRIPDGKDTDFDASDFKITPPTKGTFNKLPEEKVIFNEILPNPKGNEIENEFIELKNEGDFEVDLENWKIETDDKDVFSITSKNFKSTKIPAKGFFVIFRKDSKIPLSNSKSETLFLFNDEGILVDTVSYPEKIPEDLSFARDENREWQLTEIKTPGKENKIKKPNFPPKAEISAKEKGFVGEEIIFDGSDSFDPDDENLSFFWDFGDGEKAEGVLVSHSFSKPKKYKVSLLVKDQKGATDKKYFEIEIVERKTTLTESEYKGKVFFSEIFPNPKGKDDDEFIEIYNFSDEEIDLTNWVILTERNRKSYTIPEGTKIGPKKFLAFFKKDTKIILNNDYEKVKLFDNQGNLVDLIFYEKAPEGFSFSKRGNKEFEWTEFVTPQKENEFSKKEILENLSFLKNLQTGETLRVKGIVSVQPGIFDEKIFYLKGSGIQVYLKKGNLKLDLGDLVEIEGELSEYKGEKRIIVESPKDVKILGKNFEVLPEKISLAEIEEEKVGSFVEILGEVSELKRKYFVLTNDKDEIKVYFKSNLKMPKIKEGDKVKVKGILSKYLDEFRILPRYSEDLEVLEKETKKFPQEVLKISGENFLKNASFFFLFLTLPAILATFWLLKKKI